MKEIITIGSKNIGKNEPVFIIAEAGVNHNGSVESAMKLIDAAKDAGADAVKFQTFTAKDVAISSNSIAEYAQKNLGKKDSMVHLLKKLELSHGDFVKLKEYCDKKEIMFLSTPSTFDAVDFLDELVSAFKIASGDLTNILLLQQIAKKGKPILLSTGMATLKEVSDSVSVIQTQENEQIILLHCTTQYPTKERDVNLRAMQTLQKEFDLQVGYSDHTLGSDAAKLAVKLGAVVLEKHFTLDKASYGPDHRASLEPDELKSMISAIRNKIFMFSTDEELLMGKSEKQPTAEEIDVAKIARKSIVANKDIAKGEVITKDAITIKQPGTGLSPRRYESILGKSAKRDIKSDSLLTEEDI